MYSNFYLYMLPFLYRYTYTHTHPYVYIYISLASIIILIYFSFFMHLHIYELYTVFVLNTHTSLTIRGYINTYGYIDLNYHGRWTMRTMNTGLVPLRSGSFELCPWGRWRNLKKSLNKWWREWRKTPKRLCPLAIWVNIPPDECDYFFSFRLQMSL